ncbi:MAG: hypothetical protein GY752_00215 [bacterium]|nr:hypothetical protein [bacterium]MCP4798531.1 hypothetical protein [bacterium]
MRKILFLFLLICCSASAVETIQISSGPKNSLYYTFGQELANYLNSEFAGEYEFISVESEGSVQNIFNLCRDPQNTKIAISQEDVLSLYSRGDDTFFLTARDENDQISHLGRIFSENVFFVTRKNSEGNRIHPGAIESGSYATFKSFRRNINWQPVHDGEAIESLENNQVDAIFKVESAYHTQLDSLSNFNQNFELRTTSPNNFNHTSALTSATTVPDSLVPSGMPYTTTSISAVILCNRSLPTKVADKIVKSLKSSTTLNAYFPGSMKNIRELNNKLSNIQYPEIELESRYSNIQIPPHPVVAVFLVGDHLYIDFIMAICIWILLWLTFDFLMRYKIVSRIFKNTRRHMHLLFAVMTLHLTFLLIIKWFEVHAFLNGLITSSMYLEMSFLKFFNWMLTFLTNGYTNKYPYYEFAKLLPTITKMCWFLLAAYSGAYLVSYLTVLMQNKRRRNMIFEDHIVICNWNSHGQRLLELLKSCLKVSGSNNNIVILADSKNHPSLKDDLENDYEVIPYSPWEITGLEKAHIDSAKTILIMQPDNCVTDQTCDPLVSNYTDKADGVVMRAALAVSTYVQNKAKKDSKEVTCNILAELFDPDKKTLLTEIGVNEVIISRDIGMSLLAQAVTCRGITTFFNEVLDPSIHSNEIYFITLPKTLQQKEEPSFQDVMGYYRENSKEEQPVTPIGILYAEPDGKGKKFDLNPTNWKYKDGDLIIVLADTQEIASII